nr:hypothetical protein SBE_001415 [Streptomyces sp. SBE_14.2]
MGEVLCAVTASVVVLGDSDCGTSVRLLPIDLSDLFPLFHSGGTASTGTTATK